MKKEILELLSKDADDKYTFTVLALPAKGKMHITLRAGNPLGVDSVTLDTPKGLTPAVGSKVIATVNGSGFDYTIVLPPEPDKPAKQERTTTPNHFNARRA